MTAASVPAPRPLARVRVLTVCNVDSMVNAFLLPWLRGLASIPVEVHLACHCERFLERFQSEGFTVYPIPFRRSLNPFSNLPALLSLVRLLRSERFDLVVVHSTIIAAIARIACILTRVSPVMYCVHGFYNNELASPVMRSLAAAMERLLALRTDAFLFVSDEDRRTAETLRMVRPPKPSACANVGVNVDVYYPDESDRQAFRRRLGWDDSAVVIGITARIVREKGFTEFTEMAARLSAEFSQVRFLVVGDSLPSDRDSVSSEVRSRIEAEDLRGRFHLTGQTNQVPEYLRAMDIFVLPSYREGFPRSVLEAMATALPVIASDIRGCREAVVPGVTGLIVRPRNAGDLTGAVRQLVLDSVLRGQMGEAGRQRVREKYEERQMTSIFLDTVARALPGRQLASNQLQGAAVEG